MGPLIRKTLLAHAASTALALMVVLGLTGSAQAHTPVQTSGAKSKSAPMMIDDPVHSRAYFATLNGGADYYTLTSDKPFNFYASLSAPKLGDCAISETFSMVLTDAQGRQIDARNGAKSTWVAWYEKFGKNWYWNGPEFGKDHKAMGQLPAGTYQIKVTRASGSGSGNYILGVGDDDRFGLSTMLTIGKTARALDPVFWPAGGC